MHYLSTKKNMTPLDQFHTFLHFYDSIWPEVLHPMWSCGRTHDETRPISTYDTMSQRCAGTQPAHGQRWDEATTGCVGPWFQGNAGFNQLRVGWGRNLRPVSSRKYVNRILFQLKEWQKLTHMAPLNSKLFAKDVGAASTISFNSLMCRKGPRLQIIQPNEIPFVGTKGERKAAKFGENLVDPAAHLIFVWNFAGTKFIAYDRNALF